MCGEVASLWREIQLRLTQIRTRGSIVDELDESIHVHDGFGLVVIIIARVVVFLVSEKVMKS